MPFELAEIVAELVQSVLFRGELEGDENGFMDLFGGPASDRTAVMQENLKKPHDPDIGDFNAGIANGADGDGQGDPLHQRKVHMDVQALSLETGEAIRN